MPTRSIAGAPLKECGGQRSYLRRRQRQFGSRNLAVTWVECPPGSEQPQHEQDAQEQVYVIVRGRGLMMIVGAEEREITEGTLVCVPPRTAHAIRNTSDQPMAYVSATAPPFDDTALGAVFAYAGQRPS